MNKMLPAAAKNNQPNLFYGSLMDLLDSSDPLIALADTIEWEIFEKAFASCYSDEGRPAKPIRLMVGLLLLKQLENLSDENIVLQFKRNPYYQYFCGFTDYVPALPCDATELVHFRKRIGKKGVERIFRMSVQLHGNAAEEKQVLIDMTVQEKNITYALNEVRKCPWGAHRWETGHQNDSSPAHDREAGRHTTAAYLCQRLAQQASVQQIN